MAQGDVVIFNQFYVNRDKGVHNLDANSIKIALIDNSIVPSATTADPRWGAGGSTDLSAAEVTPGGNYAAGGVDITSTVTLSAPYSVFDGTTNPSWPKDAAGPEGIYKGILYDNTSAGKEAIGYVDMGTNISNVDSNVSITWDANGILRTGTAT